MCDQLRQYRTKTLMRTASAALAFAWEDQELKSIPLFFQF